MIQLGNIAIDYVATNTMKPKPLVVPVSIGRQLNITASVGNAVCNQLLEPHDLTLAQWAVLSSLWQNGDMSLKDLAKLTGNAPPATSRIVERMVMGGLLLRTQNNKDRRAVSVSLSPKAEGFRYLHTIYEDVNAVLLADLTASEQAQLFKLLRKVEENARNWVRKKL